MLLLLLLLLLLLFFSGVCLLFSDRRRRANRRVSGHTLTADPAGAFDRVQLARNARRREGPDQRRRIADRDWRGRINNNNNSRRSLRPLRRGRRRKGGREDADNAAAVVVVWVVSGPVFAFSDTWQLVINTGTTIVTFLMVFLIQNTQNRDMAALQLKLDELIRANKGARNALLALEDESEQDQAALKARFSALADSDIGHS